MPPPVQTPGGISIVSAFTGLNIENIISASLLQNPENKTYCRLFTREGENLLNISGEYQTGRNLFSIWGESAAFTPGYSMEQVRRDWEEGTEGYAAYTMENADRTYVYYKPVADTGLILMDIQMPHMNGYEAARRIRALPQPEEANVPIIAMTANAFADDRQEAFGAGMNGHVAKPIEIQKLVEALRSVLNEHEGKRNHVHDD